MYTEVDRKTDENMNLIGDVANQTWMILTELEGDIDEITNLIVNVGSPALP